MDEPRRLIPAVILPSHQPTMIQGCPFPGDREGGTQEVTHHTPSRGTTRTLSGPHHTWAWLV